MPKITSTNTSFASKRACVLNTMDGGKNKYMGIALDIAEKDDSVVIKTEPDIKFPKDQLLFHQADVDIAIFRKRNGEHVPKVVKSGDEKKYNVKVWLPAMMTVFSQLGENGSMGSKDYSGRVITDPKKAKFTLQMAAQVPEELEKYGDKFVENGESALKFVQDTVDQAMGVSFHDVDTLGVFSDRCDDDDEFKKGATHSVIKNSPNYGEIINLTRNLQGFQGEPQQPVFWRLAEDNSYERMYPKFIPRGTMLSVEMTFRAYQIPGQKYGMCGDLGKHILIVHMPTAEKPAKEERTTVPFDIPYIPF